MLGYIRTELFRVEGGRIVADINPMLDLCAAVERCDSKTALIHFISDGESLTVFSQSPLVTTFFRTQLKLKKSFKLAVVAKNLIGLFKKLRVADVSLKITAKFLTVEQDNVTAKLPAVTAEGSIVLPEFAVLTESESVEVANGLRVCIKSVGKTLTHKGIIIDNEGEVGRIVKFSNTAMCFYGIELPSLSKYRCVVSHECATAFVALRDRVSRILVSQSAFGAEMLSGVVCCMQQVTDDQPRQYLGQVGLVDNLVQLPECRYKYTFNKVYLINMLELLVSVLGTEEAMVICQIMGETPTGEPVWGFSATMMGAGSASENVAAQEAGPLDLQPFRIQLKRTLGAVRMCKDVVHFINYDERFLAVSDAEGVFAMLLLKAAI